MTDGAGMLEQQDNHGLSPSAVLQVVLMIEHAFLNGDAFKIMDEANPLNCWECKGCHKKRCPAYGRTDRRCWHVFPNSCLKHKASASRWEAWLECSQCEVFQASTGSDQKRIHEALRNIIVSLNSLNPEASQVKNRFANEQLRVARAYDLTSRETEILGLIVEKLALRDMTERLSISDSTIKMHITHIYRKMKVKNRADLLSRIKDHLSSIGARH